MGGLGLTTPDRYREGLHDLKTLLLVLTGITLLLGGLHWFFSDFKAGGVYWFNLDKERNLRRREEL